LACALSCIVPALTHAQQVIRISTIPILPTVPVKYGIEKQWFKNQGLNVELAMTAGARVAMQAVMTGDIQLAFGSFDAAVALKSKGADIVIVSGNNRARMLPPDGGAVVVRADSGIKRLRDLAGKTILVNSLYNVNWIYTREAILKDRGSLASVKFREMEFPHMLSALSAQQADAASTTEPFTSLSKNGGFQIISYIYVDVQPGLNVAGWTARGDWVRNNRDAVLRFKSVLQKLFEHLRQHPDELRQAILRHTQLTEKTLYEMAIDEFATEISIADLQKQIDLALKHGAIDASVDARALVFRD